MTLLQKIMSIYGTPEIDLPVVYADAAMNWFYRSPRAALDALEACGEVAIEEALSAVEKEIGPGWRPIVINFYGGELTFLPAPSKMVDSVLENFYHHQSK